MTATIIEMPNNLFNFAGQAHLDTYLIEFDEVVIDFDRYDDIAFNGLRLAMEAYRLHADDFSFWQRADRVGRPAYDERTVMIAFLVQQLLGLTFRETEGVLAMVRSYYRLEHVPDHSTLSRKLSSQRWTTVLERFFQHVLPALPKRSAVVATDAIGYSGRKRGWWETKHAQRALEDWVKVHAGIEVDEFIVLSYKLTRSNVHDSQMFAEAWDKMPSNVIPTRSLADAAYWDEACLATARQHGATPLHGIKKNARDFEWPKNFYQKLVNFAHHWPNRLASLYAKRAHAETVFIMIDKLLGYRLRCRGKASRRNEVRIMFCLFNLIQLAMRKEFWSS